MTGIGIDVVEISRLEAAMLRHPRLEHRCFTDGERAYCRRQRRPGQHFAARFAAKEAVAKALGVPLRWREIEVIRSATGAPAAHLHGQTAALAAGREALISMSHSGDMATAAAIAQVARERI